MEQRRNYTRYNRPIIPVSPMQHTREDENCLSLAMVYAPKQSFRDLYDDHDALKIGTVFKELNKPFKGCRRPYNG